MGRKEYQEARDQWQELIWDRNRAWSRGDEDLAHKLNAEAKQLQKNYREQARKAGSR